MKLIGMTLSILLGSYWFALAQNSGSAVSPPNKNKEASEKAATTGTNTKQANPTNALDDKRVPRTTGNPGLQTGPVK
jgi:hypothetical protein